MFFKMVIFNFIRKFDINMKEFCIGNSISVTYQLYNDSVICSFEGIIVKIRNKGVSSTITVKKVCTNVNVLCTFFVYSPLIKKIDFHSAV